MQATARKLNRKDLRVLAILKEAAKEDGTISMSYGKIASKLGKSVAHTSVHYNIKKLVENNLIEIQQDYIGDKPKVYRIIDREKEAQARISAPFGSKEDALSALKFLIDNSKDLEEENIALTKENEKLKRIIQEIRDVVSS